MNLEGMSPNQPIVSNSKGGKQSATPYAMHLVPPTAILEVAKVLEYGAKRYGANNWRDVDIDDHLNHVLAHIYAYLAGDDSDNHLSHAACRILFAVELEQIERPRCCKVRN